MARPLRVVFWFLREHFLGFVLCLLPVTPPQIQGPLNLLVRAKTQLAALRQAPILRLPLTTLGTGGSPLTRLTRFSRLALALGAEDVPGAPPGGDEVVDVAHVVLGLAHVGEPGAAGALGAAPDDLDAEDVGAVDLVPHLDAELGHVVAQQDGAVDAGAADGQADAGEGLAAPRGDLQHVARLGGVAARPREEGGAQALGVQAADLLGVVGGQRRRGLGSGGGHARVDGEGGADWDLWIPGFEGVWWVVRRYQCF